MGFSGLGLAPYRSNLESPPANLDGSPELADLLPPEVRVFLWMASMSFCEERWRRLMHLCKMVESSDLTWTVLSTTTRSGT